MGKRNRGPSSPAALVVQHRATEILDLGKSVSPDVSSAVTAAREGLHNRLLTPLCGKNKADGGGGGGERQEPPGVVGLGSVGVFQKKAFGVRHGSRDRQLRRVLATANDETYHKARGLRITKRYPSAAHYVSRLSALSATAGGVPHTMSGRHLQAGPQP